MGLPRSADIAPVQYEPVVGLGTLFRRDVRAQVLFHGLDCLSIGKPQSSRKPENVRVHSYHGLVIDHGCHDIGGFPADSGELLKLVHIVRHL